MDSEDQQKNLSDFVVKQVDVLLTFPLQHLLTGSCGTEAQGQSELFFSPHLHSAPLTFDDLVQFVLDAVVLTQFVPVRCVLSSAHSAYCPITFCLLLDLSMI